MAVWWQGKHFSGAAGHIPSSGSFPSLPCLLQLPAMVRYILVANEFPEYNLYRPLLDLAEAQPSEVVMALLRVAPLCDRAALAMWKSIMCSPRTAEPAMLVLLDVLGSWPEHSTCTSDGDHTAVLALAATVVMWKILQLPCVPQMVTVYFPRLFVHLLFQVLFSTLDMPEEVDTFWKGCQQQYGLASNPNRFAVRTLKSLLCQMQHEDVVVAMERKCGWDTLLCADTHHCAVGLLAREMSCVSIPLCSRIARYLLRLLSTQEPRWELPSLAFLVELSLKASAASLSCLPALCPLLAAVPGTVPAPCAAAWAQPCAVLGSCRPVPCHCPVPFRASSAWN
nr:maestro heat-like repeat-containing protein family member 9 isoform X4 [Taeniopygia guttata]